MKHPRNACPLIIDEALVQAMDQLYSRVELFPFEARAITETAVDDISMLKPKNEEWNYQLDKFGDRTLEVNLLDIQKFAEKLLEFGHEGGIFSENAEVKISPLSATLAAQRVVRIVQETWNRSRDVIIQNSVYLNNESKEQVKRPSEYCEEDMKAIISSLGLLYDNFSHCKTGYDLIGVPRVEVRKTFGLSSSLLLLRFLTVQRVLQLLELWSDRGISCGLPSMEFSREVQAWGLLLPALEQQVECASFAKLLSCYRTVNRTTDCGWRVSLLTKLCSRLAGKSGTLVPASALEAGPEEDENRQLSVWVELCSKDLELDIQFMDDLYQDGLILIEEGGREGKLLVLVPLLGVRILRSDFGISSNMLTAGTVAKAMSQNGDKLICQVDNMESLITACERFDWFDCPTPDTLQRMAGGFVEIVASPDIYTHHRVGVRLLYGFPKADNKKKNRSEASDLLIDALPIECLTIHAAPVPPSTHKDSESRECSTSDASSSYNNNKDAEAINQKKRMPKRRLIKKLQQGNAGNMAMDEADAKEGGQRKSNGAGKGKRKDISDSISNSSTIATESGLFGCNSSAKSAPIEPEGHVKNKPGVAEASRKAGKDKLDLQSHKDENKRKPVKPPLKGTSNKDPLHRRASKSQSSASDPVDATRGNAAKEYPVVMSRGRKDLRLIEVNDSADTKLKQEIDVPATRDNEDGELESVLNMQMIKVTQPKVTKCPVPIEKGNGDNANVENKSKNNQKLKMPPLSSWMRASAVNEFGRDFDLQLAMERLEKGINQRDPAHLHPAYQAMLRLEQSVRDYHGLVTREDMEETVKNFAVLKLLGKSIQPAVANDIAARHSRGVKYTEYAQYLKEVEQAEREEAKRREEEEYVQAGRAIALTQVEYQPFDPVKEADKLAALDVSGSNTVVNAGQEEPYLQVLKARKISRIVNSIIPATIPASDVNSHPRIVLPRGGAYAALARFMKPSAVGNNSPIAIVTETRRVVKKPNPEESALEEKLPTGSAAVLQAANDTTIHEDITAESERLASRLQYENQTTSHEGTSSSIYLDSTTQRSAIPTYTSESPRPVAVSPLLEVRQKPIQPSHKHVNSVLTREAVNDSPDNVVHDMKKEKSVPYWKSEAIQAVATDVGVGTRAFSERVTAHANVDKQQSKRSGSPISALKLAGSEPPDDGVAPSSNIFGESIAIEEAVRRRREAAMGGRKMPVGALFARIKEEDEKLKYNTGKGAIHGTGMQSTRADDFVDFVQGSRLCIQRPKNRFYRALSRTDAEIKSSETNADDIIDTKTFAHALSHSKEAILEALAPRPPHIALPDEGAGAALFSARTELTDTLDASPSGNQSIRNHGIIGIIEEDIGRPITAPSVMENEIQRVTPRVKYLEGLSFLQPSLDDTDGIDYYGQADGMKGLQKLLQSDKNNEKHRLDAPWTLHEAAPAPYKVDREIKREEEKRAREARSERSKAKFRIRPEIPSPSMRPMTGLPSSLAPEVRASLREEATTLDRKGMLSSERLRGMQESLLTQVIEPSIQSTTQVLSLSANIDNTGTQPEIHSPPEEVSSRMRVLTNIPTLPSVGISRSADKNILENDIRDESDRILINTTDKVGGNNVDTPAQAALLPRSRSPSPPLSRSRSCSPSAIDERTALKQTRGYPNGPYRFDLTEQAPREGYNEGIEAAAQANASSPRLAQIGSSNVNVSVKVAPPLYLSRQREQIEFDKANVKESGFDLGELIDDLLARRERAQARQEKLASVEGSSTLPAVTK